MKALGIDPGFAKTGMAAIDNDEGQLRSRGVRIVVTKLSNEKRFHRLRASMDDVRRCCEHWKAIAESIKTIKPNVIGIEAYVVYPPQDVEELRKAAESLVAGGWQADRTIVDVPTEKLEAIQRALALRRDFERGPAGLGQAAKTILVYGIALGEAFKAETYPLVFTPQDIKRRFCGRLSASKEDVARAVAAEVHGLDEQVAEKVTAKLLREHVYDAAAHAVLALEEYSRLVKDAHIT